MNIIKLVLRFIKGRPWTDSYILQLPLEILLEILAYLPLYSQFIVYQTCHPLRAIIYEYFFNRKTHILAKREHLLYLTHLARSRPDRRVCAPCLKLHRTHTQHTSSFNPYPRPKCEQGKGYLDNFRGEFKEFTSHSYFLNHRCVQLTLKYTRLDDKKKKYQRHLQRLLTPHHRTLGSPIHIDYHISGRHSAYPKVINGRYLLLCI
jgi:hypothetical protein